ncbi:hypothetical protein B0H16DRAFT_1881767 [Mycena metata]|uniref:Uncharacterized protein n=1 Tax=Mycena metata TaxID=1033252 RepID=A0AAD7JT32_9AGAR|nr:hypothetical protein B0H16DRAFT_1881767 [Mycena metata]
MDSSTPVTSPSREHPKASRQSSKHSNLGAMHHKIRAVVDEVIPIITPMEKFIKRHEIDVKLKLASAAHLHDLQCAGGPLLTKCFGLVLHVRVAGERPAGHSTAIQDQVLSADVRAALVDRADTRLTASTREAGRAASIDALNIFFAALCTYGGVAAGVAWFEAVLGPAVSAADSVYLTFGPMEASELAVPQQDEESPSYHQALALLLPSTPSSLASEAEHSASSSTSQAPARTGKDDWSELDSAALLPAEAADADMKGVEENAVAPPRIKRLVRSVAGVLIDEGHGFFNEAFPDGVQALAAKGAVAFVSGVWSALASNAPRGQKRKADIAAGASPSQRRRIDGEVAVPTCAPSTTPPAVPSAPVAPSSPSTKTVGTPSETIPATSAPPVAVPPTSSTTARRHPPLALSAAMTSPRSGINVAHAVLSFNALAAPAPALLRKPHSFDQLNDCPL